MVQPVQTDVNFELDVSASTVGTLYKPKGWIAKHKSFQTHHDVQYLAPDTMTGAMISIRVTPQEWRAQLPNISELARKVESHLALNKYAQSGSLREELVDGYSAMQGEWETHHGVIRKTLFYGVTTYCECHDQAVIVDGWCDTKHKGDFCDIYRFVIENFQFEPLPDESYSYWLSLTANSYRYFNEILQILNDPRKFGTIQHTINQTSPDWEMKWRVWLAIKSGLEITEAKLDDLTKPYLMADKRFWTMILLFGRLDSTLPYPGPTPPLVRRIPEFFEEWVRATTFVLTALSYEKPRDEIEDMLLLMRNDPDRLHADTKDIMVVSKNGREASAFLRSIFPSEVVSSDLAELLSKQEFGVPLRMRLYRGAQHYISQGGVKPLRAHANTWRQFLSKLCYTGKELEYLVSCIQADDYLDMKPD
jgi:hypothetical protein